MITGDVITVASAGTLMVAEDCSMCESHQLIHGHPSGSSRLATQEDRGGNQLYEVTARRCMDMVCMIKACGIVFVFFLTTVANYSYSINSNL